MQETAMTTSRKHKCPGCRRTTQSLTLLCMACYERTPEGKRVGEGFANAVAYMAKKEERR